MIKIEFNDLKLKIPSKWQDIRLADYEKWFMLKPQSKNEYIEFVANICKIDVDILLNSPTQLFEVIVENIQFVFESNVEPKNKVNIKDKDYFIHFSEKLSLAEWVDVEATLDSDSETKISEVLAIVCRPVDERYEADNIEVRKELFRNLTCDKALPLISFFLHKKKKSEAISSLYSTVLTQANQSLRDIKTFVVNGTGTKRLPIWQRIRYIYLTKSLEKQLSKFSDFYSIK